MMEAFEHWFGPIRFYEDSFKLSRSSYLEWNIRVLSPMETSLLTVIWEETHLVPAGNEV
jgi:hypothetical protein